MCSAPSKLKDGTFVACRGCDLCRDNRLNDLIGRCVAEQCTAGKTFAVTLTYSGDGPETAALRYADVQLMLKRLRKAGYQVRYICAGEYGTKKGRAHWHIILFFYGHSPQVELGARINWQFWPHGFVYFQNPDYKGFRYVMKYALKQDGNEGESKALSMSKKPPLGWRFFMELADDLVERRLPLHSPEYRFAHVLDRQGKPRTYWLQGRMREMFIDRYYIMWRLLYKKEPPWTDFLLEKYLDPIERRHMENDPIRFEREQQERQRLYAERRRRESVAEFTNNRQSLGFLVLHTGKTDLVQAFSGDTADVWIGDKKWQVTVGNVTVSEQLLRGGLPKQKLQPVLMWLESQWRNHRATLQKLKR